MKSPRSFARRALLIAILIALSTGCDRDREEASKPAPTTTASAAATAPKAPAGPEVHEKEILSPVYEVDKIYKSMTGPYSTEKVALAADDLELLWIVGFEAIMVKPDGDTRISQEFMCHTNLDVDPTIHNAAFGDNKAITGRLFTLSQGQYRIDLPDGYGIPILSNELLSLNTQVLNLNREEGKRKVRHRVIVRYVKDSELDESYKALFTAGAFGLKLLDGQDGHHGLDPGEHEGEQHTACLPGQNAGRNEFSDEQGRRFTGHWVVEPGREVNHTRVTDIMALPFDTTLHYVAVHLHPFAESLKLEDLTTGETLYAAETRQADEGIGLAHVDRFSSEKGIPLYQDHEYEIVSVYDNTSGEPQDSMAVMNLYLHDKSFEKPDLAEAKKRLEALHEQGESERSAEEKGAKKKHRGHGKHEGHGKVM